MPSALPSIPHGWRVPLLVGGASLPFTLASYQSDSMMSLSAVVFAGLVAGYLTGGADRVGGRTGFVGGLATLWPVAETLALVPTLTGPPVFLAAVLAGTVVFGVLGMAFSILLGKLGAWIGGWLARRTGHRRPVAGS